jgi:hypothetical protein
LNSPPASMLLGSSVASAPGSRPARSRRRGPSRAARSSRRTASRRRGRYASRGRHRALSCTQRTRARGGGPRQRATRAPPVLRPLTRRRTRVCLRARSAAALAPRGDDEARALARLRPKRANHTRARAVAFCTPRTTPARGIAACHESAPTRPPPASPPDAPRRTARATPLPHSRRPPARARLAAVARRRRRRRLERRSPRAACRTRRPALRARTARCAATGSSPAGAP